MFWILCSKPGVMLAFSLFVFLGLANGDPSNAAPPPPPVPARRWNSIGRGFALFWGVVALFALYSAVGF